FRAHERTECEFAPSVNLLYGPNGAGKTNVLEAVHYLCLSKGFVTSSDRYIVRKGAGHAEVEGAFTRDEGRDQRVRMAYVPGEGKRMFVNGAPLDRISDIVGQLPVVVYSPEDHALTSGGPSERRRFLNNLLSQAGPLYLDALLKYRRVLKQRNRLLSRLKEQRSLNASEVLASWDEQLVAHGSRIMLTRARFVREFEAFLDRAYEAIEAVAEKPTIKYDTIASIDPDAALEDVEATYREELLESVHHERRREVTLVGPHRDELVFRLNGMLVRRYASQGQHRTFGMSMKLAKYFYLQDRREEFPILLLDDVFDHLDRRRSRAFLELLQSDRIGQTIITATDRRPFAAFVSFEEDENQALYVEGGRITRAEAAELGA
ncbi:MAG: DNA replication/repair protein RecF, partial [Rhodothermales bacterium]